ncbi:MAG: PDZ domain-containing protein [Candidatus Sericytochromatia bacterium]|nr:PDZ domain-containing protein [Candidatus Sericytochromatia bacterium]
MPTLCYTFDLTRPHTHLVGVALTLPAHGALHTDLVLPAWLPGAYKIFDNARNIRGFAAVSPDGEAVRVERVDWQTWRVYDGGEGGVVVRYDVYCNKPEIHQGQLDAEHGFLNPGVLAVFPKGHQEDWPVTLELVVPEGWRVATGLKATGPTSFKALHYEQLIDCPLQCGDFAHAHFTQDGVRYEVVYEGATPWDPALLIPPLRRIVTAASDLWGRPPLDRYVFMYLETEADFLNGLEHANSTIITGPVTDPQRLDGLLTITTHEFFHLWNVKRLRPVGFGPFDYTREAHTTALWVAEGFTEYYTDVLMRWAGLHGADQFLASVAGYIEQLHAMPGRRNMSLEEASWTTWHFGDDRWNGALNYYVKGYLLGVALDLTLRERSDGEVSLDDVMRGMWEAYGAPGINYRPEDVCRLAERLLGDSLEAFWAHHLRGRDDWDWDALLRPAGLMLLERNPRPALQADGRPAEGGVRLESVLAGGAAQEAGLQRGDVLVAIGGLRATTQLLHGLGEQVEPGDTVEVHYFRRDVLRTTLVTMARQVSYALVPSPGATASQNALRAAWLAGMPAQSGVRA